jgi:hypothetical protein
MGNFFRTYRGVVNCFLAGSSRRLRFIAKVMPKPGYRGCGDPPDVKPARKAESNRRSGGGTSPRARKVKDGMKGEFSKMATPSWRFPRNGKKKISKRSPVETRRGRIDPA